jgi:3-phenylpropionate/cinnamic acid dioxygenase small subunit
MSQLDVQNSIEQFYYEEAELLDSRRFKEWLALFEDNATDRVGSRLSIAQSETQKPLTDAEAIFHIHDDKNFLTLRVERLGTGFAHVEEPPSFTRRLIGNVRILKDDTNGGSYKIAANILVVQFRQDGSTLFAGGREDLLRKVHEGWRVSSRSVILDHLVLPRVLSIFF